jgi:hypothetical protein
MPQKVVTVRMSISNQTIAGKVERDFIEHTELNKLLEEGWEIVESIAGEGMEKNMAYMAITFVLARAAG